MRLLVATAILALAAAQESGNYQFFRKGQHVLYEHGEPGPMSFAREDEPAQTRQARHEPPYNGPVHLHHEPAYPHSHHAPTAHHGHAYPQPHHAPAAYPEHHEPAYPPHAEPAYPQPHAQPHHQPAHPHAPHHAVQGHHGRGGYSKAPRNYSPYEPERPMRMEPEVFFLTYNIQPDIERDGASGLYRRNFRILKNFLNANARGREYVDFFGLQEFGNGRFSRSRNTQDSVLSTFIRENPSYSFIERRITAAEAGPSGGPVGTQLSAQQVANFWGVQVVYDRRKWRKLAQTDFLISQESFGDDVNNPGTPPAAAAVIRRGCVVGLFENVFDGKHGLVSSCQLPACTSPPAAPGANLGAETNNCQGLRVALERELDAAENRLSVFIPGNSEVDFNVVMGDLSHKGHGARPGNCRDGRNGCLQGFIRPRDFNAITRTVGSDNVTPDRILFAPGPRPVAFETFIVRQDGRISRRRESASRRVAANDEVSNHRPRKLGLRLGPFTNRQRNRECQPGDIPGRDCNPFRNNRLRNNNGGNGGNGGNTNQGGNQDPLIELRTRECLPGEVPGVDCRGDFRGAFVPNRECRPGDVEGVDCRRSFPDDAIDLINQGIGNRDNNAPDRACGPGDLPGVDCREGEQDFLGN